MSWSMFIVAVALAQAEPGMLTPKQRADLQAAGDAYRQGDPLVVVQRLAPLAAKEDLVPELEQELQRQKLLPLADVLTRARLALLREEQSGHGPRASRHETLLLVPAVKRHVDSLLDNVAGRPVMRDVLPLPDSLWAFRDVFTQLDAVEGQVEETERAATFLRTLARGVAKDDLEKLAEDLRAMVDHDDAGGLVASLDALRAGLEERRVELCIERLKVAVSVLSQPQAARDQLLAAALWNADYQRAIGFLKKPGRTPRRPALREKDLSKQVTALGEQARKLASGQAAKAKLLHEGLEWWLRGRYGAGPQAAGLVKSEEQMRTAEGRYQLSMPAVTPKPTDPFAKPQQTGPVYPQYQRRHLYTWACGNRYVHTPGWAYEKLARGNENYAPGVLGLVGGGYQRAKFLVSYTPGDEKAANVSQTPFEKENERVTRLVGFLEYAQALARFDQLIKTASDAELFAMDDFVKSQEPFTIYVNLSRGFAQTATTAFPERVQRPDETFERRGLAWVVALARLELAAMLAAFSPNAEAFQRVPPSANESPAYEELLIDAMRMHLWGLQNDALFQERNLREAVSKNEQIGPLYERRTRLALRILVAVRERLGQRATPFQREELRQYEEKFTEYLKVTKVKGMN